jgi:glycosyltransferase involved in cell wall biosynthesis
MLKKALMVANTDWYLYNFRFDLIMALKSKGYEPVLVSPSGLYVEKFNEIGFRHIPWEVGRKSIAIWKELRSIREIKKIYQREKPDVVHHHTNKAVLYGTWASNRLGIPVVNSIPGRGYVFSSEDLRAKLLRPIVQLFFRVVLRSTQKQHLIFENRSDMQFFIDNRYIPPESATLIPSVGVNPEKFAASPVPRNIFTVAFIGRLLEDKGVGVFVEAAKILSERGERYKMVLVGATDKGNPDSYTNEEVQTWVDAGFVEWWGFREDIKEVYEQIHVLAYPTNYGEGVPTTLVEAAASKRAVIASDWPGCREVISHNENGILIPPKNAGALADAIQFLATHKIEYDQMRLALYDLAVEKFNTTIVNSQTIAIYENLLKR